MKRCERVHREGKAAGEWRGYYHALFCAECRGAREADRRLARGARALREPSVPPALREEILSRLGLPAGNTLRSRRTSPLSRALCRLSAPVGPVLGSGAIALLAIFALGIWRAHPHRPGQPPSPVREERAAVAAPAPPQQRRTGLRQGADRAPAPAGTRYAGMPGGRRDSEFGFSDPSAGRRARISSRPLPAPAADDLAPMNGDPATAVRQWAPQLPPDEWRQIEARVRAAVRV